ncbi:MAG: universal stress protein [Nitrospirota bacterium]
MSAPDPAAACRLKDRHLLLAVDASENAERAVLYIADFLGGLPGFTITLLTVVPEPPGDYFAGAEEHRTWIEQRRAAMAGVLGRYKELLVQAGFDERKIATRVDIRHCPVVARCILEAQQELDCCTVIIGRRGISKKEELVFGSTSSSILHAKRSCAVWVIG